MYGLTTVFAAVAALVTSPGSQTTTIPFTFVDNRIVVSARIDGVGPFAMIVDTGSSTLIVTPAAARRLGLGVLSAGRVTGVGNGSSQLGFARIARVSLGTMTFSNLSADVIDLGAIQRAIGFPHLDGIIGYSILRQLRVEVNTDGARLVLARGPLAASPAAQSTPFTVDASGLIHIQAAVDGVEGSFVVDTGDRSSLTLFRGFATANGFYDDAPVRDAVTGIGVGGLVYGDLLRTTVSLFGTNVEHVLTRASRNRGGAFALGGDAASIGNGLLKRFNVVYDYPDHEIVAWPSGLFDVPDRYVRLTLMHGVFQRKPVPTDPTVIDPSSPLSRHALFGAVVAQRSGGVTATAVIPGAAAAAAGVRVGDVVIAVGGRTVTTVAQFLRAVHTLRTGTPAAFTILRAGARLTLHATPLAVPDEHDAGVTTRYESMTVDDSLRRTLVTVPDVASGPRPAVLLIGGIGCYSIDVASNPQDPYLHLTHDLTRAGFITMRVEKSGVGDSQGPPCSAVDFDAEVRGYQAGLDALAHDPRVDPARIYLLGHSIGTIIAPRLALTNHVAGVIVAEAVGRDWPEYEIRNLRRQLELAGISPANVDEALIEKAQCMQQLLFERRSEVEIESTMPQCATHNRIYPASDGYVQQVGRLNVIAPWLEPRVPVLAIYGTADFETELADHQRIVDVVNAARAGAAELDVLPDMSHFLGSATLSDAFAHGNRGEPYDEALSTAVIRWLDAH